MKATVNRLYCALFRHAPSRVIERVGEWTIRGCPRCHEMWAVPSTWWLLHYGEDVRYAHRKLTEMENRMLRNYAAELDAKLVEGLDKHAQ